MNKPVVGQIANLPTKWQVGKDAPRRYRRWGTMNGFPRGPMNGRPRSIIIGGGVTTVLLRNPGGRSNLVGISAFPSSRWMAALASHAAGEPARTATSASTVRAS